MCEMAEDTVDRITIAPAEKRVLGGKIAAETGLLLFSAIAPGCTEYQGHRLLCDSARLRAVCRVMSGGGRGSAAGEVAVRGGGDAGPMDFEGLEPATGGFRRR